ncbi:MAG TPA: hypothetical protein PLU43_12435, partial [Lachnospiraceae bacterium]|nr:hypothetical protein [Lachnospiraceae bacterium]
MSNKKSVKIEFMEATNYLLKIIVSGYVLVLFLALPLYYNNRYYNIGDIKFLLYKNLTWLLFILMAAVLLLQGVYFLADKIKNKEN